MNWVKSLGQSQVFFFVSSLSLGIHGLALMIPVEIKPTKPQVPPLQTISLIPSPPKFNPPTSQIQIPPTLIASPSISSPPNSQQPNSPQPNPSTLSESQKASPSTPKETRKETPTVKPIGQNSKKQEATKQTPAKQEPAPSTKVDPIPEKPEIENPEQFAARTQATLTQVTGQLRQQYGDRFAERSETIAASPELFFTQPELFYDNKGTPRSGFDGKPFQIEKETPEKAFKGFESNLQKSGFTVSALEKYGGGLLYEVRSKIEGNPEKVAFYLNLLLIPDQSGTIVVIWTQRPQQ